MHRCLDRTHKRHSADEHYMARRQKECISVCDRNRQTAIPACEIRTTLPIRLT